MTQVCDLAAATSSTASDRPSVGDRVFAAQLAELDVTPHPHLPDLRAVLALVASLHDDACHFGALSPAGLRQIRETGARWAEARRPLDPLLLTLRSFTNKLVEAVVTDVVDPASAPEISAAVRATGTVLVRELLAGFQQAYDSDHGAAPLDRQELASNLLWSNDVPTDPRIDTAGHYAVVAVHRTGSGDELGALLDNSFRTGGALSVVTGDRGYVLLPADDEQQAADLCHQAHRLLDGEVWFAMAWRSRAEVSAGRQEATSVLALARGRAPGVYRIEDVLVEYAVMQDASATGCLVTMITPILRQEALHTTLEVFIAANGNRSKAANLLQIHRSTLDYRLSRIEQLTGCQPTSARGVQMLATALATYNALHSDAVS